MGVVRGEVLVALVVDGLEHVVAEFGVLLCQMVLRVLSLDEGFSELLLNEVGLINRFTSETHPYDLVGVCERLAGRGVK